MKGIAYETITIDYGSQAIENRHKNPLRNESQNAIPFIEIIGSFEIKCCYLIE
jgi:hypothetical protein